MADIAPLTGSSIPNFGLMQQQQAAAGASANLQNQQAGLVGQQTQGAALQNANAAIQYQLFRNAVMDFSGQPGGSDTSGTAGASGAGAATPTGQVGGATGQSDSQSDTSGVDDFGMSPTNPAAADAATRARYFVNPAGTPQEQYAIRVAALSGNAGLLQSMTLKRDNNVATRTYLAQQDASNHYDQAVAVVDAPDGQALQILQAIPGGKNAAAQLQQQHPDDTPEEMDERVRDWVAHIGANLHQYTGRPVEKDDAGVYRDKVTGLPVLGVVPAGMSQKDYDASTEKLNTLATVKNSDGTESQMPQYRIDGFKSAAAEIQTKAAQARALQQMPNHPAFAGTPAGQPGATPADFEVTAHAHVAQGVIPGANGLVPAPGAAPGAPGQPGAQPGAAPGAPGGVPQGGGQPPGAGVGQPSGAPGQPGAQRPDNGLLPGVNPDALPKIQMPAVVAGRTQSPLDASNVKMIGDERTSQLQASAQASADDAKQRSLLQQAQRELATINPRTVGPGSSYYNDFQKAVAAATGKAPNAYVDQVVLDKFLNQIGAGNVRQLLQGQRITNQEMMTFLTRGSPSTEQPLAGIQRIVGYMSADNDYDSRLQKTKIAALQRGADPFQINSALEGAASRADYIRQRTGMNPLSSSQGGGQGAAASQPDSGGFVPGRQYKDKSGNTATYAGNGKWQ